MPGAVYKNSSSGHKERTEHNGDRAIGSSKNEHPANIRLDLHAGERETQKKLDVTPPKTMKSYAPRTPVTRPEPAKNAGKTSDRTAGSAGLVTGQGGESHPQNSLRTWAVRLTPSTLIMLGVLLLVTLCFFFLFGLIIGRGSVPPANPPQLEHLLPSDPASPEAPERILPEEDLRFMTSLKTDNPSEAAGTSGAMRPSASPVTASGQGQTAEKKTGSGVTQAQNPQDIARQDTAKYDFVVRAAAFKSEEKADDLRARLEGSGMRTRLVREKAKQGTWYYVQILYRGTTDGVQKIRDGLSKFGIGDTIIASKTPVK